MWGQRKRLEPRTGYKQRSASSHQELGRDQEGFFPTAFRPSMDLLTPWFQALGLQNCERIHFHCSKHCACGHYYKSRRKLILCPKPPNPWKTSSHTGSMLRNHGGKRIWQHGETQLSTESRSKRDYIEAKGQCVPMQMSENQCPNPNPDQKTCFQNKTANAYSETHEENQLYKKTANKIDYFGIDLLQMQLILQQDLIQISLIYLTNKWSFPHLHHKFYDYLYWDRLENDYV